ncbi:hypothetical protein BS78_02G057200 [Paspalum vaginatum]|nr:hypothetical protein BS78_02G057200 [Paspalum vaginatum]
MVDGQLSLSFLPAAAARHRHGWPGLSLAPAARFPGRRQAGRRGDSRKVCSAPTISSFPLNQPTASVFCRRVRARFFSYPATNCSAPRRQRAWLSARLDSSMGFMPGCPPRLCLAAGRQGRAALSSLQLQPMAWRWLSTLVLLC